MNLDTSHFLDFITDLTTIQNTTTFLEKSLNAGLELTGAESGMIVFFDFEEGQEAGSEVYLLRSFLAFQLAQTRATFQKNGFPVPDSSPLGIWLPKTNTLLELPENLHKDRHVLVIPLITSKTDLPIGFVLLMHAHETKKENLILSSGDQNVLSAYGRGVANSWESLRAFNMISRRASNLSKLADVTVSITANHDLPELLQQIMQTTAQLLQAETCSLMLLDHNTDELIFRIPDLNNNNKLREFRQSIGEGVCGYVVRTGKPTIVNNVKEDTRFNQEVDHSTGFQTRSIICVPMIVRDKIIGVIEGINKLQDNFTSNDLDLLQTLSAQAAIAIENAELYASLITERDKLIAKEEEVRKELGRDLHDGPAQVISGIAMRIDVIKKLLASEPWQVLPELNELERIVINTAKDIRTMMFGLRPLILETKGLISTLEAYVEKLQTEAWNTHLIVEGFDLPNGGYQRLTHNVENTFFIIIQEAINNIRKHAQPKNVWIKLTYSEKETVVMIQDDGKGFDFDSVTGHYEDRGSFGLLNMKERAHLINASYYINSKPGQGTTIAMVLPSQNRARLTTGSLSNNIPLSTINR